MAYGHPPPPPLPFPYVSSGLFEAEEEEMMKASETEAEDFFY